MSSHRPETAFAPRDHEPWSLEEQKQVMACTGNDRELALKLGRSEQAVVTKRHYIRRHGYTTPAGPSSEYTYTGLGAHGDTCPGCNMALPLTGVCDDCG